MLLSYKYKCWRLIEYTRRGVDDFFPKNPHWLLVFNPTPHFGSTNPNILSNILLIFSFTMHFAFLSQSYIKKKINF